MGQAYGRVYVAGHSVLGAGQCAVGDSVLGAGQCVAHNVKHGSVW
jgi:hypothetical protein